MKLLVISNLYPPYYLGGYELTCELVCRELARRGHRLTVLTSTHGLESERMDGGTVPVHRALRLYLPFGQPPKPTRSRQRRVGKQNYTLTRELIAREQPDVIFVWSQLRLTLGPARAAQDSGVPVAYTFNDEHIAGFLPARLGFGPRAFIRYAVDRWILPEVTLRGLTFENTTCISRLLKQNLIRRGLPIDESKVIYHGISLADFPPKSQPGEIGTPARVLYVGQLLGYKGVHTLIEAAHIASAGNAIPALDVSIVGDGPEEYKQQLRSKAREGRARVGFLGKVDHARLPGIYREHGIFVFPSTWQEPFGLTHLEAMASGTTVISTADGGHGEFLEDGVNALVFQKEDAQGLAGRMMQLILDKDLSRFLAANARAVVETRFSTDRYVSELEAFLMAASGKMPAQRDNPSTARRPVCGRDALAVS